MATVIAGQAFAAGLRTEFLKTYDKQYSGLETISVGMERDVPSDKYQEKFFYYESAPYMRLWGRGDVMHESHFKGIQWTVTNYEWAESIPWHYADRSDDQTQSLLARARDLGKNASLLDEQNFFDILTNTVSSKRLDAIPNCPDGNALYYSSTRFGNAGGNVISGSGVAGPAAVRTDLFSALERFLDFTDTEGEPLLDQSIIDQGVTIFASNEDMNVFEEAFGQKLTTYSTVTAGNVAVSNVFQDTNRRPRVIYTQRLATGDWYVFLNAAPVKPMFSLKREGIQDVVETFENSDKVRRTGIESIRFWERRGYGLNMPYATIKVNN